MLKVRSHMSPIVEYGRMIDKEKIAILFVCMGNICRSPTAEGVMRKFIEDARLHNRITVDSAGTHDYHVGECPDRRAQMVAHQRGYDLSTLRARQIAQADFHDFDLLLAMDAHNLALLQSMCPLEHRPKVGLFMDFARHSKSRFVPDPYCRGAADFERVLDYIEDACSGLIEALSINATIR